jgi:hypothetical protein
MFLEVTFIVAWLIAVIALYTLPFIFIAAILAYVVSKIKDK